MANEDCHTPKSAPVVIIIIGTRVTELRVRDRGVDFTATRDKVAPTIHSISSAENERRTWTGVLASAAANRRQRWGRSGKTM